MAMYERRQLLLQKADPLGMTNKGQQLQLQVQLLVPKQIPFGDDQQEKQNRVGWLRLR
jgi:hypothetical protein